MTPERVIAAAIRYDHRPSANARDILKALEDAGWTVRRVTLPETERVYSLLKPSLYLQ